VPTPVSPTSTWSVAGTIVDTSGRGAIAGAQITPSWELAAVTSGSDGTYSLAAVPNPPTNPYKLTVTSAGFVPRETWVTWERAARTNVTLDIIRDAAPFSMDFYRQLVRGTYDQPGAPWPVLRWDVAPKFYLKTVDQNGRPIEPEVLSVVREALHRAVPAYTGGKLNTEVVESGVEVRAEIDGWVNIDIVRDPNEVRTCGTAFIGRNPSTITLFNDVCSCGSRKIPGATVMHEVGHVLGYFHVSDENSVMYPFIPGNCPPGDLSPSESFHAAIAYSRPRGNTDPDNDPASGRQVRPQRFEGIFVDR
jgi:hypothetical protein